MPAYHRPNTLEDALGLLAQADLRLAAGCTDLYPLTQGRTLPWPILDLTAIDALKGICKTINGWRIGATTTWSELLAADLPAAFDGLKLAAREVGSAQIQNAGTIVGNICTASPAGDGIPCLLTLNATVDLQSAQGSRSLSLSDFLTGARQTARDANEIVTAIEIPDVAGQSDFLKLGARKYLVISIAMVATRLVLDKGVIQEAAISVGACAPVAMRLRALESALLGCPAQQALDRVSLDLVAPGLSPIDDIRADADYRIRAAVELIRRSLARLCDTHEVAA